MRRFWLISVLVVILSIIIVIYALTAAETDHQSVSIRQLSGSSDGKSAQDTFNFDSYYEGVDYIIVAYYAIEEGELGEVIVPEISSARYYDYDDELNLTFDELVAYQEAQELYEDMLDESREIIYKELAETIIHELAHIITLSIDQADWVEEEDSNPQTYFIFEHDLATKEDSYINQYFQLFWADIYEEWSDFYYQYGVLYEGDEGLADEYEEILLEYLDEFYEKYRERFVTDYAAASSTEDIAEAFVFFVSGD